MAGGVSESAGAGGSNTGYVLESMSDAVGVKLALPIGSAITFMNGMLTLASSQLVNGQSVPFTSWSFVHTSLLIPPKPPDIEHCWYAMVVLFAAPSATRSTKSASHSPLQYAVWFCPVMAVAWMRLTTVSRHAWYLSAHAVSPAAFALIHVSHSSEPLPSVGNRFFAANAVLAKRPARTIVENFITHKERRAGGA